MSRPKIAISSCLLGHKVRYDGQHTLDQWLVNVLGKEVDLIPICPEVAMGLSIPREPIHIVIDHHGNKRLRSIKSNEDFTVQIAETSKKICSELDLKKISGVILQKKSPSCGVERLKNYNENHEQIHTQIDKNKRGFFADYVLTHYPLLPVIESGRLYDQGEKELFFRYVYLYSFFQELDGSMRALQDFHARSKFLLMEYHQDVMRTLGGLSANSLKRDHALVYDEYKKILFSLLQTRPKKGSQINVFQHIIGFFKNDLKVDEKNLIMDMFSQYRQNCLPYESVVKMLEFLVVKYQHAYLMNHYYFRPYPPELRAKHS